MPVKTPYQARTKPVPSPPAQNKGLPEDWKWVKLGEACEKVETVKRKEKDPEEELIYLDIGGIDNLLNKILSHKNYKWHDAPSRAQQVIFKNDVLFSTVRTYMKNIALVEHEIYNGQIASSGFCVIRGDKKVTDPKYIFYYSISENFLRPLNELQTGTSYPAVRDKDVFIQPFPLPPIKTQQLIVSKIEELFSELDKGIENLKTAQQQLKTYRQSVLKWAFEGKLINKNIKEGELPEGWTQTTLGKIISISSGNSLSKSRRDDEGEYLVYGGNGVTGKHSEFLFEEEKLIIGRVGVHCGNAYITQPKSWVTDNAFIVSFNPQQLCMEFLLYLIKILRLNKYSNSTAQPVISQRGIYPIEILLPSIEEQNLIIRQIEKRLSVADKMEESISQSLQQAEALRQSILKKAFEGRLV